MLNTLIRHVLMKREGVELEAVCASVMQYPLYYLQITQSIPEMKSIDCLMHNTYICKSHFV